MSDPAGRKPSAGDLLADPLPQLTGAQRGRQLLATGAAADPHQPEVAYRGTAGLGFTLDVDHLMAALDGLPGVHGAEYACSNDYDSHGVQLAWPK